MFMFFCLIDARKKERWILFNFTCYLLYQMIFSSLRSLPENTRKWWKRPSLTSQMQVCVLLGNGNVEWSQWNELSSLWLSRLHVKSSKSKTCFSNWGKISVPRIRVSFAHWHVLLGENNFRILKIWHFLQCCCYVLKVVVVLNVHIQYYSTVVTVVCSSKHKQLQVQGFSFATENSLKQLITFSLFWKELTNLFLCTSVQNP